MHLVLGEQVPRLNHGIIGFPVKVLRGWVLWAIESWAPLFWHFHEGLNCTYYWGIVARICLYVQPWVLCLTYFEFFQEHITVGPFGGPLSANCLDVQKVSELLCWFWVKNLQRGVQILEHLRVHLKLFHRWWYFGKLTFKSYFGLHLRSNLKGS